MFDKKSNELYCYCLNRNYNFWKMRGNAKQSNSNVIVSIFEIVI
jgi:hypothetical protein